MNDPDRQQSLEMATKLVSDAVSDAEKIRLLEMEVEKLKNELKKPRTNSRGPKAINKMNKEVAWSVRYGDYRHLTTREAAETIGLTYGQIYSAKNLFTFKDVDQDSMSREQANFIVDALVQNTLAVKGANDETSNCDTEENGPVCSDDSRFEKNDIHEMGA